jgi:hypothetical protein
MKRAFWAGAAFFLATLALPSSAAAQTRLFSEDSELQIVVEGPIGDLVRTARRSTDPFPAAVLLGDQRFEIELSARGFSRRTTDICSFPPIRLDFDKPALRGTILQGQNRLKLVTRCRTGATYETLTVMEYLTYRLYNEITPLSFRVRPVRTTFRDSGGRRREETQLNFLIEDVDDLAERNGLVALETMVNEIPSSQLDPQGASRVAMFQFMIGNLDWDMVSGPPGDECCHNGKLLAVNETSRLCERALRRAAGRHPGPRRAPALLSRSVPLQRARAGRRRAVQ